MTRTDATISSNQILHRGSGVCSTRGLSKGKIRKEGGKGNGQSEIEQRSSVSRREEGERRGCESISAPPYQRTLIESAAPSPSRILFLRCIVEGSSFYNKIGLSTKYIYNIYTYIYINNLIQYLYIDI